MNRPALSAMNTTALSRRTWIQSASTISAAATVFPGWLSSARGAEPAATDVRDIGSRRELFVDHWLIDRLTGAHLQLHEPQLAPPMTQPADNLEYGTVIKDGEVFRLYTREHRNSRFDGDTTEVTRYCESRDGIHWTRPKLGLHEVDGTKENNVILHKSPYCHNFSPFLDARPGVPAEERFKALAGTVNTPKKSLVAFLSGDGVHWRKLRPEPVLSYTKEYAFDSQNVSFWSESEQRYVCYFGISWTRSFAPSAAPLLRIS